MLTVIDCEILKEFPGFFPANIDWGQQIAIGLPSKQMDEGLRVKIQSDGGWSLHC